MHPSSLGLSRRSVMLAATALSLGACAGRAWTEQGIDVSSDNGAVNWDNVASAGVGFAMIRAAQGVSITDPNYAGNQTGARQAGLKAGAYHVFNPSAPASDQARHFLSVAQFQRGDLPPMLDIENAPDESDVSAFLSSVNIWLETVGSALKDRFGPDKEPGLYLRTDIWRAAGEPDWSKYPLWLAEWTQGEPNIPQGWSDYTLWQYSDEGRISGIAGPVDMNRASNQAWSSLL